MKPINVYVPNLPTRTDRRKSICDQFAGRKEFRLDVVTPIQHEVPAYSLWKTFINCVKKAKESNLEYFIFCEDDHIFTSNYSYQTLYDCIEDAKKLGAEILSGGVAWYTDSLQIRPNLFWLDKFNGMQFTIIYSSIYEKLLNVSEEADGFVLDWKLSEISNKIFCIYPCVSSQKEFGYSDLNESNGKKGVLLEAFGGVENRFHTLDKVRAKLNQVILHDSSQLDFAYEEYAIPTYIINIPERKDRREHVLKEFDGRREFDIHLFPAIQTKRGAEGLWQSIRRIVELSVKNNDDVIIICEDDHTFTAEYSRDEFLCDVISAGIQGCQVLLGGIGNLANVVPVSERRWWLDWFWCTQFMVIYKSAYSKILQSNFGTEDVADEFLANLLTHKQVLWPFISIQKDFGYSDVTLSNNTPNMIVEHFESTQKRMEKLNLAKRFISNTLENNN